MEIGYTVKQLDAHTWQFEETNTRMGVYFYLLEGEKKAVLVDSGLGNIDLFGIIRGLTEKPVEIIATHSHGDHVCGNWAFPVIYLHEADREGYLRTVRGEGPGRLPRPIPAETLPITDGQEFDLGGRTLRIIHTPGHSDGSVCVLDVERRWLYTADCCCRGEVLAFGSVGIAGYRDTMRRLVAMGDQYDTTWPGHLSSPVDKEVLARILALAEDAAAGRAETKAFENAFFKGYVGTYRDEIGIVYKAPEA